MPRKINTPEQIINKLREAEVMLSQGATMAIVSKKIGVSGYIYYRWRSLSQVALLSRHLGYALVFRTSPVSLELDRLQS